MLSQVSVVTAATRLWSFQKQAVLEDMTAFLVDDIFTDCLKCKYSLLVLLYFIIHLE